MSSKWCTRKEVKGCEFQERTQGKASWLVAVVFLRKKHRVMRKEGRSGQPGFQGEELELLVVSVLRRREYAIWLAVDRVPSFGMSRTSREESIDNHNGLWHSLFTNYGDHCQCSPLSDCRWCACVGISKGMKQRGSNWLCGWCGRINIVGKEAVYCR